MPTTHALLSVTLAGLALSATPGPSMFYILSQTLGRGRLAGVASAIGLCLGGLILVIATALGLAAVFARFDWLISTLRLVGTAYLLRLGCGMIVSADDTARMSLSARASGQEPMRWIFYQAIVVELLNPKTLLFFALFLPPFVAGGQRDWGDGDLMLQYLILGSLIPLTALPADLAVALLGGRFTNMLQESPEVQRATSWIGGILLIGIAASLCLPFIREH